MNKTKLTVVIPSYERQEYLIYAIKSCLSYDFINVIVKDNSSKSLNLDLHFDNCFWEASEAVFVHLWGHAGVILGLFAIHLRFGLRHF